MQRNLNTRTHAHVHVHTCMPLRRRTFLPALLLQLGKAALILAVILPWEPSCQIATTMNSRKR